VCGPAADRCAGQPARRRAYQAPGIANVTPAHLAEAQAIAPVVCVQNAYGIGAPADEQEFLRACGEQGVAYVAHCGHASAGP
jgi:aryl-alcohol dehydrogenase-like predicted oxidoreductase